MIAALKSASQPRDIPARHTELKSVGLPRGWLPRLLGSYEGALEQGNYRNFRGDRVGSETRLCSPELLQMASSAACGAH